MLPESQEQSLLPGIDPLQHQEFVVRKRDGRLEPFNEARIQLAIEAAFRAERKIPAGEQLSWELGQVIEDLTHQVVEIVMAPAAKGQDLEIEMIQDAVETALMKGGHHAVVRGYIIYREERRKARVLNREPNEEKPLMWMTRADGGQEPLEPQRIRRAIMKACKGLEDRVSYSEVASETLQTLYDGVKEEEVHQAMIMAARSHIEQEPAYTYVSARLLLATVYQEVLEIDLMIDNPALAQKNQFKAFVKRGVEVERLGKELLDYDLNKIAAALRPERDELFTYLGAQTLVDRYLLSHAGRRLETPQWFWMRVAMGLAVKEGDQKERWAIEFYNMLSTFRFVSSTPTLFNSGTCHPQLSSCYLSTVMDDLEHIFKVVSDDAKLSKWAGGLGNDWTNVRATGAHIKGTNGTSQGVIPFLKVANDTAVAVNQGGKRKGAMCAYLETWHLDIESFLELRKNTGDERRRTHDMNTANWIPDLFMKRVAERGQWTLFSPNTVPDLHDLYGRRFEERYAYYEAQAEAGKMPLYKKVEAFELWRKMIAMLFETGHPWITFKDPSNIRSPQDHVGVVHSSNLCTEILLNTSVDEIAVCNLGSVNLSMHVTPDGLDEIKLAETVRVAMRMLDNVVDVNFYPTPEARHANMRHRPVGLGIMGFQDALYVQRIPYASQAAMDFADSSMEFVSYNAILGSTELARERGAYSTFSGSKWDRGLLPMDTVALLAEERGGFVDVDSSSQLDWEPVREAIRKHGMRNSNTMAIAPTATISNIAGTTQSIEPTYQHLFVKSNLSGEFTVLNSYMVNDLKRLNLWDEEMVDDLKYYDGSVAEIDRVPLELKELYQCAFEVDATWLIEAASRRQKWIDMGQSLNLYMAGANGRRLNEMYMFAWTKGLKTTYYLRTLAATGREKSTLDINKRGLQPRWMKNKSASSDILLDREVVGQAAPAAIGGAAAAVTAEASDGGRLSTTALPETAATEEQPELKSATDMSEVKACSLLDPTCESCQ